MARTYNLYYLVGFLHTRRPEKNDTILFPVHSGTSFTEMCYDIESTSDT